MALSNTTRLKCRSCGTVYPTTYSLKEHSDRDHCDGPLDYYCSVCSCFVPKPDSVCPVCETKAQKAAEQKRRQEERQRDIAKRKHAIAREIETAQRTALSKLARKKCRECGLVFDPTYIDDEHHDNEACDGPLALFCEACRQWPSGLVCAVCEDRAQLAEQERQERLKREREEAEKLAQLRREREERLRRAREEQTRREKAFARMAFVPACIAITATILCFLLSAQLFTHGGFFVPYSEIAIIGLLILGIVSALSIFVVAMFYSP
jgi:uncharacterized Zn finger protein (UPF0148 family)